MKKLFLLLMLLGVLAVGCENLLPNKPNPKSNIVFLTDGDGVYIIDAAGDEVVVTVTTNVDYSITIPENAKSWLSVIDTRAESRMETQTFIISENDTFETRLAEVEFVDSNGKVLRTLLFTQNCYDKVFNTDVNGNYIVKAYGGEVNVAVTTNLEYSVVIPNAAQEWLTVLDTRVEVREETLTFIVAENEAFEERSTSVKLIDNNGVVLQTISIIQREAIPCPSNEIWYTSADGNIFEPCSNQYVEYEDIFSVFGANIVSNAYDFEKRCWVITFDDDVTTIGDFAFAWSENISSVTIPDSVTMIGEGAFAQCASLTSVTIPDSVTMIGEFAFWYCTDLTSVTIPGSVTMIGEGAFYVCSSLTSITIPNSVTTIGERVFAACTNLVEFNGKYAVDNGRALVIDGTLVAFAPAGLTEYYIPDCVTAIGEWAFGKCSNLTSVTIPNSVTTIGELAFWYCSSLTSVTIPNSVTIIGDYVFEDCSSLTSVIIGNSVTTIGDCAFWYCTSLTSVTIPDSVTKIGSYAFYYCSSLTSVYCQAIIPPVGDWGMFDDNTSDRKIYVPTESVEVYKSAEYWRDYADAIVGYDFE